jgi:dTMP kinase
VSVDTSARGCFVAFEGGEGSGKSTQARLLAEAIGGVLTREPGATALGRELRRLLLDPSRGEIDGRAEALLMAADRAQHITEVVRPALEMGRHVVSDRSAMSFLAYQGWGRGLSLEELRRLTDWAAGGIWPDVVFLIDVPTDVTAARLAADGGPPDRLEAEGDGFHERVRAGFAALADADPSRWVVVDGVGTAAEVAERVNRAWATFLCQRRG